MSVRGIFDSLQNGSLGRPAAKLGACTVITLLGCGVWGIGHCATWRTVKAHDAFTETDNISVVASGGHGGAISVGCYERNLHLLLRIPPGQAAKQKARQKALKERLGKELSKGLSDFLQKLQGMVSADYRFRIDDTDIYGPAPLETHPVSHRGGEAYVDASNSSLNKNLTSVGIEHIIGKIRSGKRFIYQIPPHTGPVYKISLAGADRHLQPVIQACTEQQQAVQHNGPGSRKAALPKGGVQDQKRLIRIHVGKGTGAKK